jgi:hypothetical protein
MFVSFPDAPSWAQTRNPAPCTALDSGFAQEGAEEGALLRMTAVYVALVPGTNNPT